MKSLMTDYEKYLVNERKYSSHTVSSYLHDINTFYEYLEVEGLAFEDVDQFVIRYYIVSLSSREYSKNSIKRNLSAISNYFNFLKKQNIVKSNPIALVDSIKSDKFLPEFLFVSEVKMLVESCESRNFPLRDKLLVKLLFYNGLRVSELVNVKISDIKSNRLKVLGKGNKERYTILSTSVISTLNEYLETERGILNHDYLFVNSRKEPLTDRGVRYLLTDISKKSDLNKNVYPHMLRHSFATYFLNNGSDLTTVQAFLGHENLSTTQIYTHMSNEYLEAAHKEFHPRNKKVKTK